MSLPRTEKELREQLSYIKDTLNPGAPSNKQLGPLGIKLLVCVVKRGGKATRKELKKDTGASLDTIGSTISDWRDALGQYRDKSKSAHLSPLRNHLGYWLHIGEYHAALASDDPKKAQPESHSPRWQEDKTRAPGYCLYYFTADLPGEERDFELLPPAAFRTVRLPTIEKPYTHFVGRKAALEETEKNIRHPGAIVMLWGGGGRGKSCVAYEAARKATTDLSCFHDGVIRVDVRSSSGHEAWSRDWRSVSLEVIRLFHTARDVPAIDDEGAILSMYEEVHKSYSFLLLLDNLDNPLCFDKLLPHAVEGMRSSVLFTTQHSPTSFPYAQSVELNVDFTADDCEHLWQAYGLDDANEHVPSAIHKLLGGLPLAVDIAFSLVKGGERAEDIVARLKAAPERVGLTSAQRSVDRVVHVIRRLLEELPHAQVYSTVFESLGACAPEGFHGSILAKVADLPDATHVGPVLRWFKEHSLIRALEPLGGEFDEEGAAEVDLRDGWYYMHSLVNEVLQGASGVPDSMREKHLAAVAPTLDSIDKHEAGHRVVERLMPSFRLSLDWGLTAKADLALVLAQRLAGYCQEIGYWSESHSWLCRALDIALHKNNLGRCANYIRMDLASLELGLGNSDRAMRLARQALDELNEEQDARLTIRALSLLGAVSEGRHDYAEAANLYWRAKKIAETHGSMCALAEAHLRIGELFSAMGRHDEALREYDRALELDGEIGVHNTHALRCRKAGVLITLDRTAEAIEELDECRRYAVNAGARRLLSAVLHDIARAYFAMGDASNCFEVLEEALVISRALGDVPSLEVGLRDAAELLSRLCRYEESMQYLDELAELARRTHNTRLLGRTTAAKGAVLLELNRREEGRRSLLEGVRILREIDDSLAEQIVQRHSDLGLDEV